LKNPKILLVLPLMFLSALFAFPALPVHAATGLVCLASDGSTTCPGSAPLLGGSVGSTLRVAVVISGSDALNGFDVQILANNAILQGTGVDLTNSILGASPTIVAECIDGVLVQGVSCAPQDVPGVLHLAAAKTGANVAGAGLLFTAIYSVVGRTASTPISFNTGCSGTSSGSTCVTVSNGTPVPNAESVRGATFANLLDYTFTATPSTVNIDSSSTATVVASTVSQGGLVDNVVIAATGTSGLPVSPASATIPVGSSATFTVGPAATGTYTLTLASHAQLHPTITHTVTVPVNVAPKGFTLSANPNALTIAPGSSDISTITVSGISGFTDTVGLTVTAPAGVSASLSLSSVSISSTTTSADSTLTLNVASSATPGSYSVMVNGVGSVTGSTASTTIALTIASPDFSVTMIPGSVTIARGLGGGATVSVGSVANFAGTVGLSVSIVNIDTDSPGSTTISASLGLTSVTLTAGSAVTSSLTIFTLKSEATGHYQATVTGTGSTGSHFALLAFNIVDWSLTPQFSTMLITNQTGIISQDIVTVTSLGGFNPDGGNAVSAVPSGWSPGVPAVPVLSTKVPELGMKVCLLDTYDANGVQIPFSVLAQNGPVAWVSETARCGRNDGFAVPTPGVPDFLFDANGVPGIQFAALSHTAPGTYHVKVITISGAQTNSLTITLVVVQAPVIHQLAQLNSVSFSATGGVLRFKVGVTSPGVSNVFVNVQISAVSSGGQFVSGTSGTFAVNGGGNANNIPIAITLKPSAIGQTFSLQATIMVGLAANALTGTSTQANVFGATFTVTP